MIIKFITCSGTNEFTDIKELCEIIEPYPLGEIAVQVSEKQSPAGSPRLDWVRELLAYTNERKQYINAALHVNRTWVEQMCRGIIVPELQELIDLKAAHDFPFFRRIQLNFKLGRDDVKANCDNTLIKLQQQIKRRFILSYNQSNKHLVRQLYLKGLQFDCLFDESFGKGVAPDTRQVPVFTDILQGYAGGINPENVSSELAKIAHIVETSPTTGNIYIDAQKGLEDEQTHLSLTKCEHYLSAATEWYRNYRRNTEL